MKLFIALILTGLLLSDFCAVNERKSTVSVPVTVFSGDTLWSICEREADIAGDTRDIRAIIYETQIHNNIKGAIYAGQQIEVRVKK